VKFWTCLAALLLMGSTACNKDSSVTEFKEESDANAAAKNLSPLDTILNAGLAIDFLEQSHSERKSWLAKNLIALADANGALDNAPTQPCQLPFQEQGQTILLNLNEKSAYPLPNGRVLFCRDGKLAWAGQDASLREKVLAAGASSEEVDRVNFYRIPIDLPNSFASLNAKNEAVVVIFDGVAQTARQNSLDVESVITGVLLHEMGQINEQRKAKQAPLKAAQDRLKAACKARGKSDDSSYEQRIDVCRKSLGAVSRPWKYAADQFIVDVLARKKFPQTLRAADISMYFRGQSATGRDPLDAHPDGVERGIQFERNLERVGVR
jgi:hypothetical protein